jgi:hypothetical protein
VRWSRASYWFAICEPEGSAGITFTEGDIDRGVGLPGQCPGPIITPAGGSDV